MKSVFFSSLYEELVLSHFVKVWFEKVIKYPISSQQYNRNENDNDNVFSFPDFLIMYYPQCPALHMEILNRLVMSNRNITKRSEI